MFCEKCGKPIEEEATLCADCAAAQEPIAPPEETVIETDAAPIVEDATDPIMEDATISETDDMIPAEEAAEDEEAPAFTLASTDAPEAPPKKKRDKKKLIRLLSIISAIVVVLGVACVLCWPWIASFFNRTFLPADKYLKKVESKALRKNADKLAEELINTKFDMAYSGDVDAQVLADEDFISVIQPYLPEEFGDAQWLSDVMLDVDYAITDTAVHYTIGVGLAEERLLTIDLIADLEESVFYLTIPELSTKPISIEVDESVIASIQDAQSSQKIAEAFVKSLPDKETLSDLIYDYLVLFINELDDVKKEKRVVLTTGGVSLKTTALTATIQEDDLYDAAEAMLKKAQTDPVILAFLERFSNNLKATFPDDDSIAEPFSTSNYMNAIADLMDEVVENRAYIDYSKAVLYTCYVDYMDNIVGRRVATSESGVVTEMFHYYTLYSSRNNFFFELSISGEEESDSIFLSGTYTITDDVGAATCNIQVDGETYLTVNISDLKEKSGTIRLSPSKALVDIILEDADLDVPSALLSQLAVVYRYNEDTKHYELDLMAGSNSLLLIKADVQKGTREITIPEKSVDSNNIVESFIWLKAMDFKGYFKTLQDAGVPKEVCQAIEDYLKDEMGLPI